MELDELEKSVKRLNAVINEFPIGAASLDDFRPVEEKIQATRVSLMRLNARMLLLKAKYKQYIDDERGQKRSEEDVGDEMQNVISDVLINAKAVKLCLHSTTIFSILSNKEGTEEDRKKLYTYMSKLFTLNDNVMIIQKTIEETSQMQLDLKVKCQKALFDYKNFLKEQKQIQSTRLQKTNPEIMKNKDKMERNIRKINIIKKLIRSFIAVSGYTLGKEELLLEMLEKHRELLNVEIIIKMLENGENNKE